MGFDDRATRTLPSIGADGEELYRWVAASIAGTRRPLHSSASLGHDLLPVLCVLLLADPQLVESTQ